MLRVSKSAALLQKFVAAADATTGDHKKFAEAQYEDQLRAIQSAVFQGRRKNRNSQTPRNVARRASKYMPHQGKQECARRLLPNYERKRRLQAFIEGMDTPVRSRDVGQKSTYEKLFGPRSTLASFI